MGQITKDFAELMVKAAESGHHTPLTAWEQKQFALAWLDRESMRAAGVQGDAARLDFVLSAIVADEAKVIAILHDEDGFPLSRERMLENIDSARAQSTKGATSKVAGWVTGLDGVSRPNPAAGAPKPPFHNPRG